jgi:hypothetical protein
MVLWRESLQRGRVADLMYAHERSARKRPSADSPWIGTEVLIRSDQRGFCHESRHGQIFPWLSG